MRWLFLTVVLFALAPRLAAGHDVDRVAGEPHDDEEQCRLLADSYERTICLERYFRRLTREFSAEHAVAQAERLRQEGVIDDCHLAAHFIGDENLAKHDYDLGRALSTCPMGCFEGCIHAGVQGTVARLAGAGNIVGVLSAVCDGAARELNLRPQCVHGVGHGLLGGGLELGEAVEACRAFDGNETGICLGGVFMEHVMQNLRMFENDDELIAAMAVICGEAAALDGGGHGAMCGHYVGVGLMYFTGQNLDRSFALCGSLPGPQQADCRKGVLDIGDQTRPGRLPAHGGT